MQSDYQTQTSSNFSFFCNRTLTPLKFRFWKINLILHPSGLVKNPEALVYSDFYLFEIDSYVQTKTPDVLKLKTYTCNINALTIENSYAQYHYIHIISATPIYISVISILWV